MGYTVSPELEEAVFECPMIGAASEMTAKESGDSPVDVEEPTLGFAASLHWYAGHLLGLAAVVIGFLLLIIGLLGLGMAVFKTQSWFPQGQLLGLAAGALTTGTGALFLGNRARIRFTLALKNMSFGSLVFVNGFKTLLPTALFIGVALIVKRPLNIVLFVLGGFTFLCFLWLTVFALRLRLGHFDEK